jgi:hypothetical protein
MWTFEIARYHPPKMGTCSHLGPMQAKWCEKGRVPSKWTLIVEEKSPFVVPCQFEIIFDVMKLAPQAGDNTPHKVMKVSQNCIMNALHKFCS